MNESTHQNRIHSSISVFFMYLKLFYFMRLFAPTAALIRMIIEICKDMYVFLILFFFAVIAFANTQYILSLNLAPVDSYAMNQNNYLMGIVYTYRMGVGDFDTTMYANSDSEALWYVIFMMETVLIQIVLLNMLIAIMADTFDKVT
jgi:hypothetical protein